MTPSNDGQVLSGESVKHTPGPWALAGAYRGGRDTIKSVCKGFPEQWVAQALPIQGNRAEREANARLIAAAPDLLEALGDLMAALDAYGDLGDPNRDDVAAMLNYAEAEKKARAAIAKATGA